MFNSDGRPCMSEKKVMNRWIVVVGAMLIQLCLGAIYAWSVFTKKITIPVEEGGLYGFSAQQAAWIFSAGLASFAVVMVPNVIVTLSAVRWSSRRSLDAIRRS